MTHNDTEHNPFIWLAITRDLRIMDMIATPVSNVSARCATTVRQRYWCVLTTVAISQREQDSDKTFRNPCVINMYWRALRRVETPLVFVHSVLCDSAPCPPFCLQGILDVAVKVTRGFVMRNRSVSIIFGSLILWAVATYFLFLDQQSVGKDQDKVKYIIVRRMEM